jgi:hypothetical protein
MINSGVEARCFLPRHGVSAPNSPDLLICFQCSKAQVIPSHGTPTWKTIGGQGKGPLNAILRARGIPIAK